MYNPKSLLNLRNQNSDSPSTSVDAIPLSRTYIDSEFSTESPTLTDCITNDSPSLELFCALNPTLERARNSLVAANNRAEVFAAIERQQKRLNHLPNDVVSEVIRILNSIQNTRKRVTQ